jgi:RNA polymerase sigma factor (sigma-70 family)
MAYTTRMSLLSRVRKGDEISWSEFYDTYKRLLYTVGKGSYALKEDEIEELIQEVMLTFFDASKTFKYDKSKGKFRNYLKRIFHFRALKFKAKRNKASEIMTSVESEEFGIEDLPEPHDPKLDRLWNEEWQKHVLHQALHEVKDTIDTKTFQVFNAVVFEEIPVQEVAEVFEVTANNVYAIKARTQKKLEEYAQKYMDD